MMVMAAMMMAGCTNTANQQKETIPTEDSLVTTSDEEPTEKPEDEENTVEPIASQMLTDEDVKKGLDFWARMTWSSQLYNELYACANGKNFEIQLPEVDCLAILEVRDFDGDGINDALIENWQSCEANGRGRAYLWVGYKGNGEFTVSEQFGTNVYDDPIVEQWRGHLSVVICDNVRNSENQHHEELIERYIFKNGHAVKVESSVKPYVKALKEVWPSDFHNGREEDTIRVAFDLDENGVTDTLICYYWPKWDEVCYYVVMNGKILENGRSTQRIGIAKSRTKGIHDLIANEDIIIRWNGKTYEFDY